MGRLFLGGLGHGVNGQYSDSTLGGYTTFGGVNFNGVDTVINTEVKNVSFTGSLQNASNTRRGSP